MPRFRPLTRPIVFGFVILFSHSLAIGPDLPLTIDEDIAEGVILLSYDPEVLGDVEAFRQIYFLGDLIERLDIVVEPSDRDEGRLVVSAPWTTDGMAAFEPGAYAQKIIVQGVWRPQGEEASLLSVERWTYFEVSEERSRPLTLKEYSSLTESLELLPDEQGERMPMFRGSGVESDLSLEETLVDIEEQLASPVGISPELIDERQLEQALEDRSEEQED